MLSRAEYASEFLRAADPGWFVAQQAIDSIVEELKLLGFVLLPARF
jgi:hypothetical protein